MARKITHRLKVAGKLVALTPLHVGGAEQGPITDMALARDGLGRVYLPGTSLGGAIRAYCGADEESERWGFARGEDGGTASHVLVDDAPALATPDAELWHGTGIHRRWGTAAEGAKYDREVLPRGTAFDFRLSCEVPVERDVEEWRGFLAWLVRALERADVPLGAAATRGLGRVKLTEVRCSENDWARPEGVIAWLSGAADADCRDAWNRALAHRPPDNRRRLRFEIHWRPKGPLMSRAARDGVVVDALPFVSRRNDGSLALTLPGSGTKGAWRGHAERIVRTVLGLDEVPEPHYEQVDAPLVRTLFGCARPADRKRWTGDGPRGSRGHLGFETCYAGFALPLRKWDRLEGNESAWRGPPGRERPMALAMHVAIDRWTGGAADSLLYGAVEPDGVAWEPLVLHLEVPGSEALAELALLWLVLRDFCAGRIPLGHGANRGYGDLEVQRVAIEGLGALGLDSDRAVLPVKDRAMDETPIGNLVSRLRAAWSEWLDAAGREASP